ncbi:Protein kinase superfamily protein [Prunus dulcis]|uniref:Protein kinase superfamily protein n=1 Tax=Prunus dulcis TaxID=3755 RepID=A0A5H2XWW9_PRUDU|nr:Protein kinase superfamily protein [Prunus dulcis]
MESGSIIYVDKMSGGSESDECVTANGRVYIPEVRNEETPAVGMKFDSLDLVYNFYNRYAFLAGFGIRLHSSFWGKNKKEILRKEFVCCKQGAYRRDETRERKRQRGISRCNCKAKIVVVKTNGSKKYTISLFAEGHNHKMTPSERMHLLRSHRHISDSTKVLTKQLGSVNIPIHQKIEGDGHDRFSRCFWADATSRRAYGFYGDVVVFDTTFNTNRYDLTFAPMLGVNNHGQTIVLACAFLSKETTESFVWMFEEFKKAMPGGEPKTIITDQDAAMTRAISIAFPTTFHRLCIWHITSKFSVKLPHSAYKEYWREFQKAIWDTDNKDEFDAKWNIVVTKAGLTDHPWLSSMFDLRESWVPAYARQFFAAGMSSSQRAEGSHGFFKQYISRRNSLMDFIIRFERALSHQRQKELVADHVDAFEVAQCILPMPMNKQMATLYTRTMFQKFEQELIQSTACFLELKTEDASKVVFNVSERKNWETRVAEVVYVKDSDHASCSCKRFEFVGIICKHILALFRRDQIEYMPDKYILKRWKKTAKSGLVSDANGNEIKDSADPGLLIKRSTMSRLASDVVEDALMSEEGCELLSETLKSLQVKLKLLKDGPSNNEVGGSSSQTQYMKDPKRVRCKGRSKRVTGAKEKAMKRGIRHCRECGHIGHDRRQCPRNLNTPTSPSNNDESTPIDRSDPLFDEFDRMHGPTE